MARKAILSKHVGEQPLTTTLETTVTSFPLERPAVRVRRRDARQSSGSLPYFIAGEENRLVTFVALATTPIFDFGNPLLLVGPSGSGKTAIAMHLAAKQAIATPINDEPSAVLYFAAVDFARQYAEAVAADDLPPLRQQINEAPILVVDDLHLIADKPAAQDELALRIDGRTAAEAAHAGDLSTVAIGDSWDASNADQSRAAGSDRANRNSSRRVPINAAA